jgi:Tol biopolymer transport system component
MLSITDLTVKLLTSPVPGEIDCEPAFSPDGLSVGFVRGWAGDFGDLFVIPISGGEPRRLTSGNSGGTFAWTPDGREIVFSSLLSGIQSLRRMSASGGTSRPIEGVGGPAARPSVSRRGNYLVYQQAIQNDNIWRINLKDERHATGLPTQAFSSRGFIYRPDFSPDGKKVAFESDRLGYSDIWVCDSDGSNCTQVTNLQTITGTARWSPDGRYLAFESAYQHFWHLYTVQVPGGRPRLVNTGLQGYVGCPNWSRDGQWIYVCSNQSGPMQLWKVPFKGGAAVQVTTQTGVYAIESDDGRSLYYFGRDSLGNRGIFRKPLNGGEETRVLVSSSVDWFAWALTQKGIYFVDRGGLAEEEPREFQGFKGKIEYLEFATGEITPIFSLEQPSSQWGGVTVSPDGKALYWGQIDRHDSYIMLVKNFR